ncbi:MAG: molybdenum cofactor guanylyltransferase [Proteobacteria bacterium]|nr:molybdenum cofactor guanylyltransferase [Pseudomonadota bacterium]
MLAAVLAGGVSRRFGTDKARFEVDGIPMVLRVANAMTAAGLDVVVIAQDRRLEDLGLRCLVEPPGERHPLRGVVHGLEHGVRVFSPCDVPFVPPEAFRLLADEGVACTDRVHPLLAHYAPERLERARELLAGNGSATKLADGVRRVTMSPAWLWNVNRRADLEAPE